MGQIRNKINQTMIQNNTSEEMIEYINQELDERDEKGVATYGQTLDECPDDAYEWNKMGKEEALDGWQYEIKQNKLLEKLLRKEKERRIQLEQIISKLTRGETI